jgi:hypothetical protein
VRHFESSLGEGEPLLYFRSHYGAFAQG